MWKYEWNQVNTTVENEEDTWVLIPDLLLWWGCEQVINLFELQFWMCKNKDIELLVLMALCFMSCQFQNWSWQKLDWRIAKFIFAPYMILMFLKSQIEKKQLLRQDFSSISYQSKMSWDIS